VFVTGWGGTGFHSPDPALTRVWGGYVSGNHRPAPVRGPPALIPWTGPRLLPPIFNGDPSGVWVGRGPERGQGQGMPKKTPRPRPLSGAGRGKGPGAHVFRGPVRPVTNSILYATWYFFHDSCSSEYNVFYSDIQVPRQEPTNPDPDLSLHGQP